MTSKIKTLIDKKIKSQVELAGDDLVRRQHARHFMLGFLGTLYALDAITGGERDAALNKAWKQLERR